MTDDRVVAARDGVRLHVSKFGSSESPVIIPGTGNEADFEDLFAGRCVVFFDIRNRGRSDAVPDAGRVGLPVEVDDIDDVRTSLGLDRCTLFAWSYPALVAALYAARNPRRVDRLVLSCPPPTHADVPGFFAGPRRRPEAADVTPAATAEEALAQRRDTARSLMWNPSGIDRLRSNPGAMPNEWPHHVADAMARVRATFAEGFDFRPEIRMIAAPTLIIHGARDGIPLASSEELCELIPDAQLVVLPEVGHLPHVEAPDEFARAIAGFLGPESKADRPAPPSPPVASAPHPPENAGPVAVDP